MDAALARQRVHDARVARLGTISAGGWPHLVPCCFVLAGDTAYTAVDAKPKSTLMLRRVRNILANPAASLLVDLYEEDWSALWWVRLDGTARVVESVRETGRARQALRTKYAQYQQVGLPGPVVALDVSSWVAWP